MQLIGASYTLMGSPYGVTDFFFPLLPPKMAFPEAKTRMKETLHWVWILGKPPYK